MTKIEDLALHFPIVAHCLTAYYQGRFGSYQEMLETICEEMCHAYQRLLAIKLNHEWETVNGRPVEIVRPGEYSGEGPESAPSCSSQGTDRPDVRGPNAPDCKESHRGGESGSPGLQVAGGNVPGCVATPVRQIPVVYRSCPFSDCRDSFPFAAAAGVVCSREDQLLDTSCPRCGRTLRMWYRMSEAWNNPDSDSSDL